MALIRRLSDWPSTSRERFSTLQSWDRVIRGGGGVGGDLVRRPAYVFVGGLNFRTGERDASLEF